MSLTYIEKEMLRVANTLTETDPRTDDYVRCLRSFESLDAIGASIQDFITYVEPKLPKCECDGDCADCDAAEPPAPANVVDFPAPDMNKEEEPEAEPEPEKLKRKRKAKAEPEAEPAEEPEAEPAPVEPVEKEEPGLTSSEVRSKLAAARKAGINITELLKTFGVDNFTALPAGKYKELLDKVYELCPGME